MGTGAITQYVDVAQLVLYAFWIFFAGLIYYLVRENHREGYPMDHDGPNVITGWPTPEPKTYKVGHGEEVVIPNLAPPTQTIHAEPAYGWAGAPVVPTGNPLVAGVGPGAWAERADRPDVDYHGTPKLVPLRRATDYGVAPNDTDPRGLTVYGGDDQPAGKVVDLWADVAETLFRYLEVELADGSRRVLVPWNFAKVKGKTRLEDARVNVKALLASQFAGVPGIRQPDVVTMLEEEKIMAYFGAGTLYAEPSRAEPLL